MKQPAKVFAGSKKFHHRKQKTVSPIATVFCFLLLNACPVLTQQEKKSPTLATTIQLSEPQLVRTSSRNISRRFGFGGTFTLVGAPRGSIHVEGWNKNEVEIAADIEVRANTEAELTQLAAVNTFVFDEDVNHLRVTTTGMNDKKYLRRVAKNFPKSLLTMPWKIDYHVRVPLATDLQIYAGNGTLDVSGVEGAIQIEGDDTTAHLALAGGVVKTVIGRGSIDLKINARSWRGSGAIVQVATGDLSVELPAGFNADVDATVLRNGRIENSYPEITPAERVTQTDHFIKGRAGQGGAALSFTVGDGMLRIKQAQAIE